jgi:hypothetical protein
MKSIKNKYLFFLLRVIKDALNPVTWEISDDLKSHKLGEYYFIFTEKAMHNQKGGQKSIILDNDGIPQNSTYVDVKDKKFVYFPITIGQVGLAVFYTYLQSKSIKDRERFLKFPDWFVENVDYDYKLGARWMTDVKLPQYKNPGPWQSAFVQSRALSVLLRGYQMTNDEKYLEMAKQALIPFTKPVSEGGVTSFTKWGPFYEEYTSSVPTLVLNGMIFSLCGVYDFVRVCPDNNIAKKIFDDGIQTLKNILPEFDLGFWSRYNLCQAKWHPETDPATNTYQKLHITQLEMLYNLTDEEMFREYSDKFTKQSNLLNLIKAYVVKYKSLKKMGRL